MSDICSGDNCSCDNCSDEGDNYSAIIALRQKLRQTLGKGTILKRHEKNVKTNEKTYFRYHLVKVEINKLN